MLKTTTAIHKHLKGVKGSPATKEIESIQNEWYAIKGKLDSLLLSTRILSYDDTRKAAIELGDLPAVDRPAYLNRMWGASMLQKAHPLLQQLETIEAVLSPLKAAVTGQETQSKKV
jgi:hypothetical protein